MKEENRRIEKKRFRKLSHFYSKQASILFTSTLINMIIIIIMIIYLLINKSAHISTILFGYSSVTNFHMNNVLINGVSSEL